jgi:phage terminase large subunit-like protein
MEVKRHYDSPTLLIEDSPISRGLIQSLREQSVNVIIYKPDTDKRARVIAQSDLFAGGSVRFPRGMRRGIRGWELVNALGRVVRQSGHDDAQHCTVLEDGPVYPFSRRKKWPSRI